MIPRAFATLTIALLKPLSCHAIAEASEAGAPLAAAIDPIWAALRRPGEPVAAPVAGTLAAGVAVAEAVVVAPAAGIFRLVPAMTKAVEPGRWRPRAPPA